MSMCPVHEDGRPTVVDQSECELGDNRKKNKNHNVRLKTMTEPRRNFVQGYRARGL